MPTKAENRHRYPRDWKQIRAAILERAGHRCEQCGIPNYAWRNNATGRWTEDIGRADAWFFDGNRVTRIVLTIAHIDHTPENCAQDNLRALCQRCHLRYDIDHHQRTACRTRINSKAAGDLFNAPP